MDGGILMSSEFNTKYTTVRVDTSDANPKESYFGYIAVSFDYDSDDASFFINTYDLEILSRMKQFFELNTNMSNKEIRIEDLDLLIDLPSVESKIYATDVVRIIKQAEEEYLKRISL
jgi:hypothetical protein